MTTGTLRKVVKIDEERCNGCGVCIPSCAEGALQIIDGKARLISEKFCDGLGACLGECPQDAITVEERYAQDFDEELVKEHLAQSGAGQQEEELACGCPSSTVTQFPEAASGMAGCPSARVTNLAPSADAAVEAAPTVSQPSALRHWPVQLTLVPPSAPFLQDADLVLAADCVPFAYAGFHQDFLKDHSLLIACPKLDDFQAHLQKLTDVLRRASIKSLTVVHMEVPCCFGIVHMAKEAIRASGKDIPLREVTVGVRGEVLA